jgi:hypothetical protein
MATNDTEQRGRGRRMKRETREGEKAPALRYARESRRSGGRRRTQGRHVARALFSLLLRQFFFVCELIYSGQTAQRANDGAERRRL